MTDGYCYVPITITVWKGDVCLFTVDCETKCEWSLPDGRAGPVDWDVTAFWFENVGTEPGKRKTVEIYRTEPLFKILYEHMDREFLDEQIRETLANDGDVDLYVAPPHA